MLVLLKGPSSFPLLAFELVEFMMLLEKRTFLYHVSGILSSFLIWYTLGKPKRFPGQGNRLGRRQVDPPSTRSWGYAHYTDDQFRRVVETTEDDLVDESR